VRGGIYHSQSTETFYCHVPGLKVVVPSTPRDAKGLLKAAIRDDDPVIFLEHKKSYRRYREVVPAEEVIPIGVARLDRQGSDVSVITYGVGVHHAREAATTLDEEGVSIEILDLRTLVPLDREAIATSVKKTGKALVLHEANRTMGFGAEIAAFIGEELFMDLDGPITRVAARDSHLAYNGPEEDAVLPNPQWVIEAARKLASF
jgi:2-oxoisovalerate dehydrogenase E1 component beta subunit